MKAVFVFAILAGVASAAPLPVWEDQYMLQGVLELPYAEIAEPFTAYWDAKNTRSRIGYYGDMVITIQIGGGNKTMSYKVAPMTNDKMKVVNQLTCFSMAGEPLEPVTPQSILPNMTGFEFTGISRVDDADCNTYQLITKNGKKKNTYTMYTRKQDGAPVRYEMFGYDSLLGSHYDKYYLNYDPDSMETGPSAVPETLFDPKNISGIEKCGDFPGPGDAEHRVLMNPMAEYLHGRDDHHAELFAHFRRRHDKKYRDDSEEQRRLHTFRQNVRFIHSTNRQGRSFSVAVNHLTDRTDGELKTLRGYFHTEGYNGGLPFEDGEKLRFIPNQVDWRLYGAVTPVKDQAVCGSCWSFGTTGAVEGAHFLKTGELVRLSQQALMDCSWGQGNNACDGGEDFRAYQWIQKYGLPSEDVYGPYLAQDGRCHVENMTMTVPTIKGYVNVTSGDSQALRTALALHGPVSIAIDASHKSLSFYANGVYYEPKCGNTPDDLDHAVLAVGYGVVCGEPYWLVKNSWSTYWGNDGYVLMSAKGNNCGVTTDPTYVLL